MVNSKPIARAVLMLMGFVMLASGCTREPGEGYYDRDHHRWWHEHQWRDCAEHDEHCHE
ncbi:MAG: hypothetical protein ABSE43_02535 [Steroidobacteraceae bacterium]|jgi:hypothetical protein